MPPQLPLLFMSRGHDGSTVLTAAVDSGNVDIFKAVLETTQHIVGDPRQVVEVGHAKKSMLV